MLKKLYYTGFVAYLFLILFSIVFYQERTVFIDIAYHLFQIIRTGDFTIQNFRFVAAVTQIFPLLASKLQFSLHSIMYAYSVGFYIYYALCYIICGAILKNYRAALIIFLLNILIATDVFYWIQSELLQGLVLLPLLFAILEHKGWDKKLSIIKWLIITAIVVTIVFAHPLLIFPFSYYLIFIALLNEKIISKRKLILTTILFVGAWLIKYLFFKTEYDSNAMENVKKIIACFPNYIHIYANKRFAIDCLHKFYWLPVFFVIITICLLKDRKWLLLILFFSYFLGFLLMVNISYSDNSVSVFYIENMYMPLTIFIAVPLVYYLLPNIKSESLLSICFIAITVSGIVRIYSYHDNYTKRLDWEMAFLKNHKNEKLIIDEHNVPMDILMMSWATPYEFWLLSTIHYQQSASIVILQNAQDLHWAVDRKDAFITQWGIFNYKDFSRRYFEFNDTKNSYHYFPK
jgi:hypothetical protein